MKTSYIIRRSGCLVRVRQVGEGFAPAGTFDGYEVSLAAATRFNSVAEATAAITRRAQVATNSLGAALTISKITETPAGPPTIRLVSTRTIDATKPCVIFCSDRKKYTVLVGEQLGYFPYQGGELSQAALFIDLNEALRAIAVSAAAWRSKGHKDIGHKNLHVHQVEIIPGAPVITETVLS